MKKTIRMNITPEQCESSPEVPPATHVLSILKLPWPGADHCLLAGSEFEVAKEIESKVARLLLVPLRVRFGPTVETVVTSALAPQAADIVVVDWQAGDPDILLTLEVKTQNDSRGSLWFPPADLRACADGFLNKELVIVSRERMFWIARPHAADILAVARSSGNFLTMRIDDLVGALKVPEYRMVERLELVA